MTSKAPTLSLQTDRTLVRAAGGSVRHLAVRITAPRVATGRARAPMNLAFCIDRSGSMGGNKLALAKQAVHQALGMLGPADRFTIVTFDDRVDVIVPPTLATPTAIAKGRAHLDDVAARGSTALCDGWLTACGEIGTDKARCFLLTDGEANVGETNAEVLFEHARQLEARGVRTVTFGLGDGFNEELLQGLATAGGGNFYFIEQAIQIGDYFTSELGEALELANPDVYLDVRVPGATCESMSMYTTTTRGDGIAVRVGDLASEQVVELLVRVTLGAGTVGATVPVTIALRDAAGMHLEQSMHFVFADHRDNDRQPRVVVVDRLVAAMYAAGARRAAVAKNRSGDYKGASHSLQSTATRIRSYAATDPQLIAIAEQLEREATQYATAMTELSRKKAYSEAVSDLRSRDAQGRARKV